MRKNVANHEDVRRQGRRISGQYAKPVIGSDRARSASARPQHMDRRVVYCETIDMDGRRLCASLNTLELSPDGDSKTRLKSTTQLASFIGEDMVKGHEAGNNASLDNLVRYLSNGA